MPMSCSLTTSPRYRCREGAGPSSGTDISARLPSRRSRQAQEPRLKQQQAEDIMRWRTQSPSASSRPFLDASFSPEVRQPSGHRTRCAAACCSKTSTHVSSATTRCRTPSGRSFRGPGPTTNSAGNRRFLKIISTLTPIGRDPAGTRPRVRSRTTSSLTDDPFPAADLRTPIRFEEPQRSRGLSHVARMPPGSNFPTKK